MCAMREKKQHKKMNWALYVVGNVALCATAFFVVPKIINWGTTQIDKKKNSPIRTTTNDDDWGPEIVRNETYQEEKEDGEI